MKKNQILIHLRSNDFSFVGEERWRSYTAYFPPAYSGEPDADRCRDPQVCVDQDIEKIEKLILEASGFFDVETEKGLTLITVRHYQKEILHTLISGREMVLQQWSRETVQTLIR